MAKYDKLITLDSLKTAITKLKEVISGKADKATTLSGYGISDSYTKSEVDTNISAKVSKAGDTMTGKLSVPQVETGSTASNYFQCRKFRGEGTADTYYHAIDFGYQNHNQVDFYEYGGRWNFWLCTSGKSTSVASCGFINSGGWNGNVKGNVTGSLTGNADTATKATQDAKGNVIDATYIKTTDGLKKWYGTKAEYDALTSYDDDTIYITTDENADTYVDSASFQAHLNNKSNPHEVTAAQLGVYTKEETYSKSEVYPKSESYSKTEVDTAIASATPNITVDAALSDTSENPVQNKVVATAIESVQKIYYGTTEPAVSLGKDGDLYILYNE